MSEPAASVAPSGRDTLIAVVTDDADLLRFRDEHWYRLPDRALGRSLGKNVLREVGNLALYQTGGITEGLPGSIEFWGEVAGIDSMSRGELLPEEPDHPAADQLYHRIRLAGVHRLGRPITCRRPRRVTFMRTTFDRLLRAADLGDLIIGSESEERLADALRIRDLEVERKIYMQVKDAVMEVDLGLFVEQGGIGLLCGEEDRSVDPPSDRLPYAWKILRFSPEKIERNLEECLREILDVVERLRRERD